MKRAVLQISFAAVVAFGAAAGIAAGLASASPAVTQAAPAAPGEARGPSPLIYPGESLPIRFDHAVHARLGATCEGCHASAAGSTTAADNLIPPEAACRGCHKIDRANPTKSVAAGQGAARCDACHADAAGAGWMPGADGGATEPPRVVMPRPNLKFNHRLHASRGIACALCHTAAAGQGMVTRADLPMMASCLGCHDGKQATARCSACHLTEPDGRLRVQLATAATQAAGGAGLLQPSGSLRGFDAHGPTFRRDHAQAGRDEKYCLSCHRRNECVDCHGGVVRPPDIHPADYVSLHVVDARRNVPDCSSCHRLQTFCVGCHQRTGVSADPSGGQRGLQPHNPFGTGTGVKQFHPPGWARDAVGVVIANPRPESHSVQARRNIRTCVSCHREESCLACHSADPTRGPTISPHGPGFAGTARCRFLSSRNQRACLKCHALGSGALDCEP
ncbi:MAG TPA: cytochrome c3 family protein [Polyangia bacterium]|nr:cytochrome c3 family protein [Polyangia bacterium]